MSDIPSSPLYIQIEGAEFRAPVSESLVQAIGGSTNWLLDKAFYILENYPPIGTILSSSLNESQIQGLLGTGWILCAGQGIVGSDLYTLTGQSNAPDLRGRYQRMKDHGAGNNPDGDLSVGQTQGDQFGSHNHSFGQSTHTHLYNKVDITAASPTTGRLQDGFGWDFTSTTDVTTSENANITFTFNGGNETRPKTTTVEFFIRINKTHL